MSIETVDTRARGAAAVALVRQRAPETRFLPMAPCLYGVLALGLAASAPPCTAGRRRHVLTDSRIASTIVTEFRARIRWLHPVNGE
jgi:hypothetical protein